MKKKTFDSIKQGLTEAIQYAKGNLKGAKVRRIPKLDVQIIRQRTGMTQTEFANAFGISVATLRHWERGDRFPHGPALVLLNLVARNHKQVLKILSSNSSA